MLTGVVLAAGDSTRMGSPKAVLNAPDGRAFVARVIRTLLAADLADLLVITGRHHDLVVDAITHDGLLEAVRIARNPDPSKGQLSSLLVGLDLVSSSSTEGLLMTLVDVPLVHVSTVTAVIDAWRRTRAPIVRPAIGNRHGHPVIFDRAVFEELRAAPLDAGAKSVVRAHEATIVNVPVDDEGCLRDVDTPADYDALSQE